MFTLEQRERLIALIKAGSLTDGERQEMNTLAAAAIEAGVFEEVEAEAEGRTETGPETAGQGGAQQQEPAAESQPAAAAAAGQGKEQPGEKEQKPGPIARLISQLGHMPGIVAENAALKRRNGDLTAQLAQLTAQLAESQKANAEYRDNIARLEQAAASVQAKVTDELSQIGMEERALPASAGADQGAGSVAAMTEPEFAAHCDKLVMRDRIIAMRQRDAAKRQKTSAAA